MFYLFPLMAVVIWAGNTIVNKLAVGIIAPEAISFYRWFFALLLLSPFMALKVWRRRRAISPHLAKLTLLALLGMVLNQSLAYFAATTTTATNMALIISLVPLFSLLLAVPLLGQRLSKLALLGTGCALAGLVFMLSQGHPATLTHGVTQGDLLLLLAALIYALYGVLLKRWPLPLSTWESVYVQIGIAVLLLSPLLWSASSIGIDTKSLPLIAFAAIGASILAPWAWMKAIAALGTARTSIFVNLLPLLTALLAHLGLGERLSHYHYLGGTLVLLGVMLAQRQGAVKPLKPIATQA
ncbi:DMT family transporter [Shewanella sp. AS16]|uniref:DMT family transporter n=1 Tax=Shewanella sp. AS16 TaxID=2907625 RepID=UPI001F2E6F6C|nr:DMT family transporter [Shewanella sp. AS16]MCE9687577.1 DMT family transporter [Shewanella sp. AS16]